MFNVWFFEPLPFGIACSIPISPWLLPCQVLPSVGSAMHELLGRMTANGSGGVASLAINPGLINWFQIDSQATKMSKT